MANIPFAFSQHNSSSAATPSNDEHASLRLWHALLTGQLAGLIMAASLMIMYTFIAGRGPLYPVQVIGSFALGDGALVSMNWQAIAVGLVLHQLGATVLWSVIFWGAMETLRVRSEVGIGILGIVVGVVSQVLDVNVLMPRVMTALHGHDIWNEQMPMSFSWTAHLVFGVCLGLYTAIHNKLNRHNELA